MDNYFNQYLTSDTICNTTFFNLFFRQKKWFNMHFFVRGDAIFCLTVRLLKYFADFFLHLIKALLCFSDIVSLMRFFATCQSVFVVVVVVIVAVEHFQTPKCVHCDFNTIAHKQCRLAFCGSILMIFSQLVNKFIYKQKSYVFTLLLICYQSQTNVDMWAFYFLSLMM